MSLGRTEMFERRIVRHKDFERLMRTLRKFECNDGGYLTKNGSHIPNKCITVYININPSDSLKAYKEFNSVMNEYLFEFANISLSGNRPDDVSERVNKMDVLLMNCYQKNRGTKHWIDIDFDIDKKYFEIIHYFIELLVKKSSFISYFIIETHSGYHVLLERKTINFNFNDCVKETNSFAYRAISGKLDGGKLEDLGFEIIVNKNEMVAIPGTYSGGFPVKLIV